MNILGISCFYHDAAAALVRDGEIIAATEEERFSRRKHDSGFPQHAIEFCLDIGGIDASALDYVVFYEKPLVKFDRILRTILQTVPSSMGLFRESMMAWLGEKLWVKDLIARRVGVPTEKVLFTEHHMAHAASAFLCSPFEKAAIVTVDGVGEWATATVSIGEGTNIRLLREVHFPHSIGLLYSAFTAFLGFEVNEGEYKVMGMAPFGVPRYLDEVDKLIKVEADGSFQLDMRYFSFHRSATHSFSQKFVDLFGPPRQPNTLFFTRASGYPAYFGPKPADYDRVVQSNQHYADVAASIQKSTEETLLKIVRAVHAETGLRHLCMAGGVALNSAANGRVLREGPFENIFIQPAAGDGGGALGAALFVYHCVLGYQGRTVLQHAYLGQEHSPSAVAAFLRQGSIRHEECPDEDRLVGHVVDALERGMVVGWFQGKSEWGPRALGNRSILADPRRDDMKDIVNTKIKFREPYRPFAPSVCVENAAEYFDFPEPARHFPSRFMLYVVNVKDEQRSAIPAVTHVDGTARVQTVFKEFSSLYHRLLRRFDQTTGIPILLNTSFNLKCEPIVNTPREAYTTFNRSEMDLLVLDRFLVSKR